MIQRQVKKTGEVSLTKWISFSVADFGANFETSSTAQGRAPQEWRLEVIVWKMTVLWRRVEWGRESNGMPQAVVVRAATWGIFAEWDFSKLHGIIPKLAFSPGVWAFSSAGV